jgi:AmmeMemoRadiSam system protein A
MSQPCEGLASVTATPEPGVPLKPEFSWEERKLLLGLAREAILVQLEGRELSAFCPPLHLVEPRGIFTTLYLRHRLRGCVGFPTPILPLYQAVIETAQGAAFDDPRFRPLACEEVREVRISLSVLSPLHSIQPEAVEVGRHGLLISLGSSRGLLLPQVASEQGWDRVMFLEQTCRKAGLPPDTWRKGARIEAFTAEVFGDER